MHKDGIQVGGLLITGIEIPFGGEDFGEIYKLDFLDSSNLGPDLICLSKKNIYGVEHFKVDSSKKNRKGSSLKSEEGVKKRKIEGEINRILENETLSSKSFEVETNLSYENLKESIYSNFLNHYEKVGNYRGNIKRKYGESLQIKIIFLVEYDNVLPSIPIKDGVTGKGILPHLDINFLNFLIDKKDIDGVIFHYNSRNIFIPILDEYFVDNKNIFDFSNYDIEDFPMNVGIIGIRGEKS